MMSRILVIEDEPNIRFLVQTVLVQQGHDVVEASNGVEALNILKDDRRFDALLVDLRMPLLDGVTLQHALRLSGVKIPTIVMSAHVSAAWAGDVVKAADAVLMKPFTRQQLLDVLNRVLPEARSG